jgi:hypothetical protein
MQDVRVVFDASGRQRWTPEVGQHIDQVSMQPWGIGFDDQWFAVLGCEHSM